MSSSPLPTRGRLTRTDVRGLLTAGEPPHVSVLTPTERGWSEGQKKNELGLADLLDRAEADLLEREEEPDRIRELLAPGHALATDEVFWRTPSDGLALFLSANESIAYRLPFAPARTATVDARYHVRTLWKGLFPDEPFYVLALSLGAVRLYRGERYGFEEVALEEVPHSLEEAMDLEEHIRSLGLHTTSRPSSPGERGQHSAIFHGGEDAGDAAYVKDAVLRFFGELEDEVTALLRSRSTPPPLVLAGVEYLRGLYRTVNHYDDVTDEGVSGPLTDWTVRDWDVDELHTRARAVVAPLFEEQYEAAVERFASLYAEDPSRIATGVEEIVPPAFDGRVENLFVAELPSRWGRFDPASRTVRVREAPRPGDTDLLEYAVARTLLTDGTVHVREETEIPEGAVAAAVLRY